MEFIVAKVIQVAGQPINLSTGLQQFKIATYLPPAGWKLEHRKLPSNLLGRFSPQRVCLCNTESCTFFASDLFAFPKISLDTRVVPVSLRQQTNSTSREANAAGTRGKITARCCRCLNRFRCKRSHLDAQLSSPLSLALAACQCH